MAPNAKFCSRCGQPAEEKRKPVFCVKCGAENLAGAREIPDHPLVTQTISDCLHETMDIDGLVALLERLRPRLVLWASARMSPGLRAKLEPEDAAQEILR